MNSHSERIPDYLRLIVDSIELARGYPRGHDFTTFGNDKMLQDAVIRRLEIIGEAARRIEKADENFIGTHPALQLNKAYGMRNRLWLIR